MHLLSDVIFGNGMSVPGGEDIAVLCDENGFPYYKGGTFKGIFREELSRYLHWTMGEEEQIRKRIDRLMGKPGSLDPDEGAKLVFSDFRLSQTVRARMLEELGTGNPYTVLECLTNQRAFTSISEDGTAQEGSLRYCRCVNKGLYFYSEVRCGPEDEELVENVISMIKWVGTMRSRGFGKVKLSVADRRA